MEPSQPDQNQKIGDITIRVSASAMYSKYRLTPSSDINFGTLLVNARKTAKFTIENTGEFEFKYAIYSLSAKPPETKAAGGGKGGGAGGRMALSRVSSRSVKFVGNHIHVVKNN